MGAGLGPLQMRILNVLERGYFDTKFGRNKRIFKLSTGMITSEVYSKEERKQYRYDNRPRMRVYHSLRGLVNRGLVEMSGSGRRNGRYWEFISKTQKDLFESYKNTKAKTTYDGVVEQARKVYEDTKAPAYKLYEGSYSRSAFEDYAKIEKQAMKVFKETEDHAWTTYKEEVDYKTQYNLIESYDGGE